MCLVMIPLVLMLKQNNLKRQWRARNDHEPAYRPKGFDLRISSNRAGGRIDSFRDDRIGTELRNRRGVSSVFQRDRECNEFWHVQHAGFWNLRHADSADWNQQSKSGGAQCQFAG